MSRDVSVSLTTQAADDLRQLHAYITAQASKVEADRMLDTLVDRCAALHSFPGRGSRPKELAGSDPKDVRQINVGNYRIVYVQSEDAVRILLIADGRRDMQTLLRQRLLTPRGSPR